MCGRARAAVGEPLAVMDVRRSDSHVDPGPAPLAERDRFVMMAKPSAQLAAKRDASLFEFMQRGGAIQCRSHRVHRLVVGDLAIEHRERAVAVAAGAHANLVLAGVAADLLAPIVGVDAVGGVDVSAS